MKFPMRAFGPIVAAATLTLSGCLFDDTSPLDDMAKCANIHFATPPKTIAQHRNADFGGGRTASVVVETTQDQVAKFQQLSAVGELKPGVSSNWRNETWMDQAIANDLKTDTGNQQYFDDHPTTLARWIVIHDKGDGQKRLYIMVYCEG